MAQITTISFFKFKKPSSKVWAFGMMQFAHQPMQKVSGQTFYRLLGTGKEQFNPFPDWSTYAVLQIWSSQEDAENYFSSNTLFTRYQERASEHWVLFLKNKIARGEWSKQQPFERSKTLEKENPFIVALTRATIKTSLLLKFWRFVPKSQSQLWSNTGLLYTKGVGEVPFKQMATLSLWTDEKSLNEFAYQTKGHTKAIGKTRTLDWYHEELFARFQPFKTFGNWEGADLWMSQINGEKG